ncbi:MAG: SDR family NAD(P)-dependent oxidoreductase [Candidatus Caldarchaeum sp.]
MPWKPLTELISLRKKRALVTGDASGIGFSIAERFAEAGADLILVDVNQTANHEASEKIRSRFGVDVLTKKSRKSTRYGMKYHMLYPTFWSTTPECISSEIFSKLTKNFLKKRWR